MDENWVLILSSSDVFHIQLLQGILNENSIECVVINKKDSAYLIGEAELYVQKQDAFDANQLLKTHKP